MSNKNTWPLKKRGSSPNPKINKRGGGGHNNNSNHAHSLPSFDTITHNLKIDLCRYAILNKQCFNDLTI